MIRRGDPVVVEIAGVVPSGYRSDSTRTYVFGEPDPDFAAGDQELLGGGMKFSIEPGIQLPGRSGARIEDILVCSRDGAERLAEQEPRVGPFAHTEQPDGGAFAAVLRVQDVGIV